MKVTQFSTGGLPQPYGTWSTGTVNEACEAVSASVSSNSYAISGIIVSGSAQSNYHLLASGSNYAAWVPDTSGVTSLDDLSDVAITSVASNDRLRYNGSLWVNSTLWWEPMVDGSGLVMLDGLGNIMRHEVAY